MRRPNTSTRRRRRSSTRVRRSTTAGVAGEDGLWVGKWGGEPILCFDGDAAGRRAAYRAIDLALPHIKPGKSLLFATLPDGHDPDDLVRSGGSGAIADVLAGSRPLGEVLWARETETARVDTPERRAGLEAR